ncbi:MAG: hypothetical protein Q9227_001752 [Pyrenula ochraceoflavens]
MPRRRGAPAASRPAAAPSRPTAPQPSRQAYPPQGQTRPASTAVAPARNTQPQAPAQQQSGGSGLFGQMASTAAGVAVGSSIGHAIGGFFGGGSSSEAQAPPQQQSAMDAYAAPGGNMADSAAADNGPCAYDVKMFTSCMDQNKGDLNICGWYMDQLKACQQASRGF